jgi:hypothetical protein
MSGLSRTELHSERVELEGKLGAIEADIASIKAEMATRLSGVEGEAQRLRTRLGQINAEIMRREAMDAMVPTISDHALLRYIERICGVDIEAMKAELLTNAVVMAIKAGASAVKSPVGTMVIKGNTVVTFLDAEMRPKRKTPKRQKAGPPDAWFYYDEGDDE